jgi:hypothetical protein
MPHSQLYLLEICCVIQLILRNSEEILKKKR